MAALRGRNEMKAKASSDNQKLMFLRHPAVQWVNYAMCLTIFSFWKMYYWQKRPNDSLEPSPILTNTLGLIISVWEMYGEQLWSFQICSSQRKQACTLYSQLGLRQIPRPPPTSTGVANISCTTLPQSHLRSRPRTMPIRHCTRRADLITTINGLNLCSHLRGQWTPFSLKSKKEAEAAPVGNGALW